MCFRMSLCSSRSTVFFINSYLLVLLLYILCSCLVNCEEKRHFEADFLNETIVSRISFGSCSNQNKVQPLWEHINEEKPDLWVWLGDAVYADNNIAPFIWAPAPLQVVAERYKSQKHKPEYKSFLKSGVPVLGVWDDHDYGMDRGGKHHPNRLQTQGIFLDFLNEPIDSLRRNREGSYVSYLFGHGDKTVKIILLDTRSHLIRGPGCDILGHKQWEWLEKQLSDNNAPSLTLIGSGIQILSDIPVIDKWHGCLESYDRLMWLLQKTPRVILLSGDVHFGEFQCLNATSTGYPLYEVTSSGMTGVCVSLISKKFCNWLLNDVAVSSVRFNDIITELNYGMVEIDWNSQPAKVLLQVKGQKGVYLQHSVSLDQLHKRSDPAHCPKAAKRPPFYPKAMFWSTVYILVLLVIFILLRISIFISKFLLLSILLPLLGLPVQKKSHVHSHPINGKVKSE